MKKQKESLDTTDNKNYSSQEFIHVEGTPFTIVREEKNYFGIIGEHRITENYDNEKEIRNELVKITWDRIIQVIWAVSNKFNKINLKELENE